MPVREKIAGAARYSTMITKELILNAPDNEYILYVNREGKRHFEINASNYIIKEFDFDPGNFIKRIFVEQFILPQTAKRDRVDKMFTPSVSSPILFKGKQYTTIHDVAYKHQRNKYPFLRRKYISLITKMAVRRSEIIFTVSNFSKNEIANEFSISKEKIIVTYNGVDCAFLDEKSSEQIKMVREKLELPEKFILYVGAIEPGKNIDVIASAFYDIGKEEPELFLVLTGGIGWQTEKMSSFFNRIKNNLIILPYISDEELSVVYKSAKMLVYISPYEGFGLPVLEALASGTPVITSTSPAIMEFSGNAVLPVSSDNKDEVAGAIKKMLEDENFSKMLIANGKDIAEKFDWQNSAKIILEYLNK